MDPIAYEGKIAFRKVFILQRWIFYLFISDNQYSDESLNIIGTPLGLHMPLAQSARIRTRRVPDKYYTINTSLFHEYS